MKEKALILSGLYNYKIMANNTLNKQEQAFCQLYVYGVAPYAGNAERCYIDAFSKDMYAPLNGFEARQLLAREDIQQYIEELEALAIKEAEETKRFIAANLKKIIEEASTNEYRDRFGTTLSPAPLRSVAVSASKALMELYPIKEAQGNKSNNSGGDGGIVFNVIMPGKDQENDSDK